MDNTNKPLYKVLNEQRTQGRWKTDEIDIISVLGERDYSSIGQLNKREDTNYTALSVNNLHILAEALEKIYAECKNKECTIALTAKAALAGIS